MLRDDRQVESVDRLGERPAGEFDDSGVKRLITSIVRLTHSDDPVQAKPAGAS